MTRNEAVKPGAIRAQRQLNHFKRLSEIYLLLHGFFFWEAFGDWGPFFPSADGAWHQGFPFCLQILTLYFWSLIFFEE